jgi:2'-5' RNA ligase
MPRLVVVLPLEPLQEGESFAVKDWPLHITVLPPFSTEATVAQVADAIATATASQPPLTAIAGSDELFGRHHDIPVTVIVENEGLTRLHHALVDAVQPLAASPDERAFTGSGFRPHVTVKGDRRVAEGDQLTLPQVALVDMAPRKAHGGRVVLATRALVEPE